MRSYMMKKEKDNFSLSTLLSRVENLILNTSKGRIIYESR